MKKDFILPDIGEGIVECELVEWLVKEGDRIVEDQPICDVMTDKALVQIPAVHNGVVTKLYYQKGEIAKVHAPLFEMAVDGEGDAKSEVAATTASTATSSTTVIANSGTTGLLIEDFILPDIGEGIVECEIVDWLVKEGDVIAEDQPVCDVMTDKALVQIPAKYAGKVVRLYSPKGQIAKVHAPLFALEREVEGIVSAAPTAASFANAAPSTTAPSTTASAVQTQGVPHGKALASPAVRRLARELNVDLSKVPGSGAKGRVYKEDVQRFVSGVAAHTVASSHAGSSSVVSSVVSSGASTNSVSTSTSTATTAVSGGKRTEPIKGIRAAMARQMMESVSTIPHFTYCEEIDITDLIALRLRLKDELAKQGVKLTMMPFFMKALSLALQEYPIMNSQLNADVTELTFFDDHNIGVAVDSKVGLLVPNIKGCQHKSIIDIAKDLTRLTDAARDGRVSPADLKGGTITISNIGALGGTVATPIINKPEVAIVALGKVQQLPRFDTKGHVVARSIMQISWSGDHRVIDGGTIARFTNRWKQFLEQPDAMLLAMK
jgi:2-oxoisovalerate dehydrogenase E2 component (dihydrolipoyl transacylase)